MKKQMKKYIIIGKDGLTHKIHYLDMRYIMITCLSCIIDHEIGIIR